MISDLYLILLLSGGIRNGTSRTSSTSGWHGIKVTATTTGAATATTTALGGVSHGLAHQSEGAFLSDEAEGTKVLDGFLASGVLLTRNDTSFVLHEV